MCYVPCTMRAGKLQFLLVTAAFGGKLAKGAPHALRAAGRRRRRSTVEEGPPGLHRLHLDHTPAAPGSPPPSARHPPRRRPLSRRRLVRRHVGHGLPGRGPRVRGVVPPGAPGASPPPGRGRFLFGGRPVATADVARWGLLDRVQQIGQLELMGVAAVYESLPSLLAGSEVIHFVDNQSALYGMAKGSSSQPDSQALISSLHVRQILDLFNVWLSYVASTADIADLPSRGAYGGMAAAPRAIDPSFSLEGAAVPLVVPDITGDWMGRAAARLRPARKRGRGRGGRGGL